MAFGKRKGFVDKRRKYLRVRRPFEIGFIKKAHPVLRLTDPRELADAIMPVATFNQHSMAFRLKPRRISMDAPDIFAVFNAGTTPLPISLAKGKWQVMVDESHAGTAPLATLEGQIKVPPVSALILVRE